MRRISIVLMGLYCFLILAGCSQNQDYITCTSCGQQVVAEAKYCSECGESIYEPQEEPVDYTILDSGYCNQNVHWEIRSDGTLFIDGNGTIPDYSYLPAYNNLAPWEQSAVFSVVKDIMIGDRISGIGNLGLHRVSINNLYIGHNVRVCNEYCFKGIWPQNLYVSSQTNADTISSFLKDFTDTNCFITLFYDGSEDEFYDITNRACIKEVNFNYNYDVK